MEDIIDFLPIYPDINDEDFNQSIFHKKEFLENKLEMSEEFPENKGDLLKHQITISRFLSSNTLYDQLLLYHYMGTGKTCTAVGVVEQIRRENSSFKGAIYIAKNDTLIENFKKELIYTCTAGQYIASRKKEYKSETRIDISLIKDYYTLKLHEKPTTFQNIGKIVKNMTDKQIIETFSNMIIIVDEIHNIRDKSKEKESEDIYKSFHRFLHLARNSKILLLSGTPIKDKVEEISDIMNLILPLDKQMPTKKDFLEKYFDISQEFDTNILYTLKNDKNLVDELKSFFRGRVSYLKPVMSTVKREYVGEENVGGLKKLIVQPIVMSDFQTSTYKKAFLQDEEQDKEKADEFDSKSRQASLFVFPDSSFGNTGVKKYLKENGQLTDDLRKKIYNGDESIMLENLSKYSSKYAYVIKNILDSRKNKNNKKCSFIYSYYVSVGIVLLAAILKLFGFKEANGNETTTGLRYILLSSDNLKDKLKLIKRFNQPDNIHGDYICVILGSKKISESFSFYHIQEEFILTSSWNYSETDQAIARGLRFGRHNDLIFDLESKYLNSLSIDEVEELCKKLNIEFDIEDDNLFRKIITNPLYKKNTEITVRIHQCVSVPSDRDITSVEVREFRKAEIKDMNNKNIERIIKESAFDCALNLDRNKILGLDNQRECDYQRCEYVCDSVTNFIPIDYSTDQIFYLNTKANLKIKEIIINLLRKKFYLDINDIEKYSNDLKIKKNYFLLFLKQLVENKEKIINKYNVPSYVYEDTNIFYIVDEASERNNVLSCYYTKKPHFSKEKPKFLEQKSVEIENIEKLFTLKNEESIKNLLLKLNIELCELVLENVIQAIDENSFKNVESRGLIYNFLKSYIIDFGDIKISFLPYNIKSDNTKDLRVYSDGSWNDANEDEIAIFKDYVNQFQENKYGIHGYTAFDSKTFEEKFYLVFQSEVKEKKKVKEPKTKPKKKKDDIEIEDKEDKRFINTGRLCSQFNNKTVLVELIMNKLGVPIDKNSSEWKNINIKKINENKAINKYFTDKNIDDIEEKKEIFYWYKNGTKDLCDIIRNFLDDKKLILRIFLS